MTEREAVAALLRTVDFLTPKQQRLMSEALPTLSDDEVRSMGLFLATYLKTEQADLEKRLQA